MIVCVFVCVSVSVGFLAQVTLVQGSSIAWRACYHGRENSQIGNQESERGEINDEVSEFGCDD